ncbi:MAG: hypothetical protein ACMXYL_03580 [Candidatus Woesearchaeota archaeon]
MPKYENAIDALADSALPRLKNYRSFSFPEKMFGLGIAALSPIVSYTATHMLNGMINVQYPSPVQVGMVTALAMMPAPLVFADSMRLLRGNGKNLSYNPRADLVAKLNDGLTNASHGFIPLLLGYSPFLLNNEEASIIHLKAHNATNNGLTLETTINGSGMVLSVPYGVLFVENSEGIGAVKRKDKYDFGLLAYAPYESFI